MSIFSWTWVWLAMEVPTVAETANAATPGLFGKRPPYEHLAEAPEGQALENHELIRQFIPRNGGRAGFVRTLAGFLLSGNANANPTEPRFQRMIQLGGNWSL